MSVTPALDPAEIAPEGIARSTASPLTLEFAAYLPLVRRRYSDGVVPITCLNAFEK